MIFKKNKLLTLFSSFADPYYILGIEKKSTNQQIKQAFFSLASQWHPDKNQSPNAVKTFLLIKQAYQKIKRQRGLQIQQPLYRDFTVQKYTSIRPNGQQYQKQTFQEQNIKYEYRVNQQKAAQSEQSQSIRQSFKTIHNVNDNKIKIEDQQMPNTFSTQFLIDRFNLRKVKNQLFRQNQHLVASFLSLSLVFILFLILQIFFIRNQYITYRKTKKYQKMLYQALKVEWHEIGLKNPLQEDRLNQYQEQYEQLVQQSKKKIKQILNRGKFVNAQDIKNAI